MIKHVQENLTESEEIGLDVTGARAFVDEIIALGNKWPETKSFPNDDFFREMFLKPSTKAKSAMDEQTKKQFVRDRNIIEFIIIELRQDIDRLDGEVIEDR